MDKKEKWKQDDKVKRERHTTTPNYLFRERVVSSVFDVTTPKSAVRFPSSREFLTKPWKTMWLNCNIFIMLL